MGFLELAIKPRVLTGSKQEIAENLIRINGEVREAIVFVEDGDPATSETPTPGSQDIFDEMRPFMVNVSDLNDSREAVYSRMEGE